jgi:hypothetical protein
LARISSAVAVQTNGSGSVFQCSMWARLRWIRALTEVNVPRRMACLVMMPNQVSIWLILEGPTGVRWNVMFGFASLVDQAQIELLLTGASVARRSSSEQGQGRRAAVSGAGSISAAGPW